MALDFVRKLFAGTRQEGPVSSLLQLATPSVVGAERPLVRVLVGGITIVGAVVAGTIALSSFTICLAALFALYYLLTEVLGLELAVDPRAFVAEAQRYAAQARAN
jgi:hypothetical protein